MLSTATRLSLIASLSLAIAACAGGGKADGTVMNQAELDKAKANLKAQIGNANTTENTATKESESAKKSENLTASSPKTEAPKADKPAVSVPNTSVNKTVTPNVEAPKATPNVNPAPILPEQPKVETAKPNVMPATPDEPAKKSENLTASTPKIEPPKAENPMTNTPKVDEPELETPPAEMPNTAKKEDDKIDPNTLDFSDSVYKPLDSLKGLIGLGDADYEEELANKKAEENKDDSEADDSDESETANQGAGSNSSNSASGESFISGLVKLGLKKPEKEEPDTGYFRDEQTQNAAQVLTGDKPEEVKKTLAKEATATDIQTALNSAYYVENELLKGVQLRVKEGEVNVHSAESNDLDVLVVDYASMQLFTPEEMKKAGSYNTLKELNDGDGGYIGSFAAPDSPSYKALRYGVVIDEGVGTAFAQGHLTKTMPQVGEFVYKGNAVYGKDDWFEAYPAEAKVNFAQKQLRVDIKEASGDPLLAFGGKFTGNTFTGVTNGIAYAGGFYGTDAQDIGGVFHKTEEGKHGAFGVSNRKPVEE